jgi:hypothetical protein
MGVEVAAGVPGRGVCGVTLVMGVPAPFLTLKVAVAVKVSEVRRTVYTPSARSFTEIVARELLFTVVEPSPMVRQSDGFPPVPSSTFHGLLAAMEPVTVVSLLIVAPVAGLAIATAACPVLDSLGVMLMFRVCASFSARSGL